MKSEVVVAKHGSVMDITIARPEARNSLTRAVVHALRDAFESASSDPAVRAVLLGGDGGHFCAGADLRKNLLDNPNLMDELDVYMDEFHSVVRAIVRCTKPTIARMEGAAVGFGADLAFACDLRIASDTAYAQEKFVKLGLMPDGGGTFWLPRLVGTARAMRMILLAEKVDAKALHDLGVVTDVVPASQVIERARALAAEVAKGPPLAYAEAKRALYASWGDVEEALRREREGQLRLLKTGDVMEGILAWSQKRDPEFRGQ